VAYLAAGINSFDGTHVYALDAATGKMRWQNSTSGNLNAEARTGVAVQGDLLLFNKQLYLAGGNGASPGVYDIADGKCVTSAPPSGGARAPRGRELRLSGERVEAVGQPFYSPPSSPVFDAGANKWGIPEVRAKNVKLRCLVHPGETAWKLEASDPATDKPLWELELPSAPVRWGLAVDAQGRIFVTLATGEVLCFGGEAERK
jgi:outer membrane protein assembly factor BamB